MKFDRIINATEIDRYLTDIERVFRSCSKDGRRVHILVEAEKRTRSTGEFSQSHHLNGHIQQICRETGNDFTTVKEFIKSQAIAQGYPQKTFHGRPMYDLYDRPVGISEADSTTEECALLIEQAHILASELGITLMEDGYERFFNY